MSQNTILSVAADAIVFLWRALDCLAGRRALVKAAVVKLLVRCFASILAMFTLSPRSVQTREDALCNAKLCKQVHCAWKLAANAPPEDLATLAVRKASQSLSGAGSEACKSIWKRTQQRLLLLARLKNVAEPLEPTINTGTLLKLTACANLGTVLLQVKWC